MAIKISIILQLIIMYDFDRYGLQLDSSMDKLYNLLLFINLDVTLLHIINN